jgi:hypothetical protein
MGLVPISRSFFATCQYKLENAIKHPISECGPSPKKPFAWRDPSLTRTRLYSTQTGRRAGPLQHNRLAGVPLPGP